MKGIGFKNFRSLKNLEKVELRDLTVLVGKNSCGKSTFLRSFPLFKQTISTDRSIPILWYSESLVDFGDYSKVKNLSAESNENINFIFHNKLNPISRYDEFSFLYPDSLERSLDYRLELSISNNSLNKNEYVDFINIQIDDNLFHMSFDSELKLKSISLNNEALNYDSSYSLRNGILPSLYSYFNYEYNNPDNFESLISLIKAELKKNESQISDEKLEILIKSFLDNFTYIDVDRFFPKFNKKLKTNIFKKTSHLNIYYKILLLKFPSLYKIISNNIEAFFSNTFYIAPIRATPQRYYRIQGLSVENVDSTGRNLSLFLKSLSAPRFNSLKTWIKKYFSFSIDIENIEGHITINIVQNDKKINLTDTGFGYSQLLPIIVQIWHSSTFKLKNHLFTKNITFVIEQPELHLHPALQVKLIDAFVNIVSSINKKSKDFKVKFIIETHSETFINRIGENIWQKNLTQEDVIIYRFEKKDFETTVHESKYDNDGILLDWPQGFFFSEVDDDFWN